MQQLHASGLAHDAVIEIMVALLGVMVAVLAVIAGLISIVFAVLGFWGYATIKAESVKQAKEAGHLAATDVATAKMKEYLEAFQASGLSESQAEGATSKAKSRSNTTHPRTKATTDKGLKKG